MWNKIKFTTAIFGAPLFLLVDVFINKNILGHALVMVLFVLLAIPTWPFFLEAWGRRPSEAEFLPFVRDMPKDGAIEIACQVEKGKTLSAIRLVRKRFPGTGLYKARLIALAIRNDVSKVTSS